MRLRVVIPRILENKGANAQSARLGCGLCERGRGVFYRHPSAHGADEAQRGTQRPDIRDGYSTATRSAWHAGKYPATLVEQLSPARCERFFTHDGDTYQIIKPIRDMCVFSIHNVVRDPPFSSLDIISCRNLLIYMDAGLQNRLIPLFHYVLSPRGYLFLGGSEGLADNTSLFHEADKKQRIYQRIDAAVRSPMFFPTADRILASGRYTEPGKRLKTLRANDIGSIVEQYHQGSSSLCRHQREGRDHLFLG